MIVRLCPYRLAHRALCWLLVAVMIAAPSAWVVAEQPGEAADPSTNSAAGSSATGNGENRPSAKLDLSYCTDRAFAALFAHPRRVLTDGAAEMWPTEVITAAGMKEIGFDPLDVEELQTFIEPQTAGPPNYVVVVKFAKAFSGHNLNPRLREHTRPGELNGKKYLQSQQPMLPSFYMPNKTTLLVASDEMLRRIVAGREEDATSRLLEQLAKMDGDSDIYGAVQLEPVRPFIDKGIGQARQQGEIPPPILPLLDVPSLIRATEFKFGVLPGAKSGMTWYANDETDAQEAEAILSDVLDFGRELLLEQMAKGMQGEDEVEQAFVQYTKRVSAKVVEMIRPERKGDKLLLLHTEGGVDGNPIFQTYMIGVLVALLLPAVQAAREAARRNSCRNNMKQLMLSLLIHESANGRFPAQANYDEEGKPLLSWRVHILPYLEEQALYEQFHLDEPWDSPHNRQLVDKMPVLYRCPSSPLDGPKTTYLAANGKGLFMEGKEGIKIEEIRDGTSKTIALVEVADEHAVIWTKPEDLEWNPKQPMAKLGSYHPGLFIAGFVDGHVTGVEEDSDVQVLKAMLTRSGGD